MPGSSVIRYFPPPATNYRSWNKALIASMPPSILHIRIPIPVEPMMG